MSALVRLLVLLAMVAASSAFLRKPKWLKDSDTRPEMWMSTPEVVKYYGYQVETHTFVTSDGYTLVMHRIPAAKNGTKGDIPIVMGHGMASCSEQWVVRAPPGPAYVLAEAGFDVWMTNYRGSFYSRQHKTLNVTDNDFWDFSWHENGVIDTAESIDYVLNLTGRPDVILVGHSMSSTSVVVLLSARPEYNAKVRGMLILAPPVNLKHPNPIYLMGATAPSLQFTPTVKEVGAEYVVNDWIIGFQKPFPQACYKNYGGLKPKMPRFCRRLLSYSLGRVHEPVNEYLLQLIMHHYPAGASIRQIMHFGQLIITGEFLMYDFGKDRNLELYGQPKPPPYNITNISTPSYILYSTGDGTVYWKDAEDLARSFRRGVIKGLIKVEGYCHIDYLIATEAPEVVYKPILRALDQIRHLRFDDAHKYEGDF